LKAITSMVVVTLISLTGCNAANVQPESAGVQEPTMPVAVDNSAEMAEQFEQLNSRITLLQEQVLSLKVQNASVAERAQLLLNQFQVLAKAVSRGANSADTSDVAGSSAPEQISMLADRLDQQLLELQQISPELGGGNAFLLATCYTAKGKWKLIRYNRFSGESWISAESNWQPLAEETVPAISSYEIQLLPASRDLKGYVAARIDQNSGDTWWLNDDTWVKYQQ